MNMDIYIYIYKFFEYMLFSNIDLAYVILDMRVIYIYIYIYILYHICIIYTYIMIYMYIYICIWYTIRKISMGDVSFNSA